MAIISLYHGSSAKGLIPTADGGRDYNDYGKGFYTTEDLFAAKEWACQGDSGVAFVYKYEFETDGLSILDLDENNVLSWVAVLMAHRLSKRIRGAAKERAQTLIERYGIDVSGYDIVRGYRADDSYFQFTTDFVTDTITDETLAKSIKLGDLGYQICIRSEKGISRLKPSEIIEISGDDFIACHNRYDEKDLTARRIANSYGEEKQSGRLLSDILRELH
jgi:hypothetical protein